MQCDFFTTYFSISDIEYNIEWQLPIKTAALKLFPQEVMQVNPHSVIFDGLVPV